VLGLPASPGLAGAVLLVLGSLAGAAVGLLVLARQERALGWAGRLVALAAAITVAAVPYTLWRISEDVRYTSGLNDDDRAGAGPIQTFLQPYLLDPAVPLIPEEARYFTAVAAGIRREARQGFRPLAMDVLFPRVSVERPEEAEWIVAWGVDPRTLGVAVSEVTRVREAQAGYPPVWVARVA
jgi:hypothetical protein